jgi:hypothetical protein
MEKFNFQQNIEGMTRQQEKEMVFDTLIKNEILNSFTDDLEDAGFDEEEIIEFQNELAKLKENEINGALSLPKELRKRNFPKFKQELDEVKTTVPQIIELLKQRAIQGGYTLGYHTSKSDILEENGEWKIKGTELDDRDNRMMAYYSLDYSNIYRVDRGSKLYVVRAEVGESTSHKRDTSNNWGRADSLPIIHKIDLTKIDEEVEDIIKQLHESNKQKQERDAA